MEEKVVLHDKVNMAAKPASVLRFETHTQQGYENLVQFLGDAFYLAKQVRKLSREELSAKFDLL